MAETLEAANAMLDLRRAVGALAWRLVTKVEQWETAADGKSTDDLVEAVQVACWRFRDTQAPTEGTPI